MSSEDLEVWIDREPCTGDGLCVRYARDVFELDIAGLASARDPGGASRQEAGARVAVPADPSEVTGSG